MRKQLRDNSLSLTMFGLFVLFLVGHSVTGYYDYNDDRHAHQQSLLSYTAYLTSGHFWATVFENWESEFLQMAAYVFFTVFLFQRGSAESKDPDAVDEVDEDPRHHQHHPQAPGRTRLRQVVDNLLGNARSHTPPGTAVHVRVARNGGDALIEVADDGPGMSAEQAERVFERFYRADPSRSRHSGGVGLGLSIVSAVTEAHGGTVSVETEPGHGTTFRVRLPLSA